MLIPFRKLFNQATKAGSSDHLILLPGTKLHSKVGSRQGSKFFLEAGLANRYDAEFPARFYFAPIAFLASVRWAALPPFALSAFALEGGTAFNGKRSILSFICELSL